MTSGQHSTSDETNVDIHFDIEPYLMTILSKKFKMVARDMTQSLLRSARSGVISTARDFSSVITRFDGQQFIIDEGLPVHSANINFTPEFTLEHFDEIKPGDAFLTNSPYAGNTHHADYTVHVPVFYDEEPLFWTINRAHQADVGAPSPSSYLIDAETIYQEGPHFPSIRIQENYTDKNDIIRMIKLNLRVADEQWHGDYLAQIASVRKGEEKIQELCDEYGIDTIKKFADAWIEYGNQMMKKEIERLPDKELSYTAHHDPIPNITSEGIPVTVHIDINPDEGRIFVDLSDNQPNISAGINLSEATTVSAINGAVFNNLDPDLPHNQGSVNRISIEMDEGKVIGKPEYPVGTALATTNLFSVLFNAAQAAFGQLGEPYGVAEGTNGLVANLGVISGEDHRRNGEFYINQIFLGAGGAPAVHGHDGWTGTYNNPGGAALIYRDSIEVNEQKYPILVHRDEIVPDTGGPGKWRGAPAAISEYGPRDNKMTVAYYGNGSEYPPKGIQGGQAGKSSVAYKINNNGEQIDLPSMSDGEVIKPGERIVGQFNGGGGYGNPLERNTERVKRDVQEGYVTKNGAREDYGVVIEETEDGLIVNEKKTETLRHNRGDSI